MSVRSSRAGQRGEAVGVTGDDVAAELVADLERALEVDPGAAPPAPDRGEPQRLGGGIDREPGAIAVLAARDHGEAHAAAGDRGADRDGVGIVAAGDPEPREPLRARLDRDHLADVGDDAGEHAQARSNVSTRSSADLSLPVGLQSSATGLARKAAARRGRRCHPPRSSDGDRNSAASSTRSARRKAAARIGPVSTMSRVMPRPARSFSTARDRASRRWPRTRSTSAPAAASACSRSRGAACAGHDPQRRLPRAGDQPARRAAAATGRRARPAPASGGHARQPAGQQRIVGQHRADTGEHRVAHRPHQMDPLARRPRR